MPVENYSVLTPFKVTRLFIDSSKGCLKCVLLHNRNIYGCIPIGHSVTMKEEYGNFKLILEQLKYVRLPMVNLCRFKNGKFSFWSTRRLQNTLVSFATGTVELTRITGLERYGYQGIGRYLERKLPLMNH